MKGYQFKWLLNLVFGVLMGQGFQPRLPLVTASLVLPLVGVSVVTQAIAFGTIIFLNHKLYRTVDSAKIKDF